MNIVIRMSAFLFNNYIYIHTMTSIINGSVLFDVSQPLEPGLISPVFLEGASDGFPS